MPSRLNHKRGRKSNYVHSLNNAYWKRVRQKILARDKKCVKCGSQAYLEVHHKTYTVNGISILGKELEYLYQLELLCSKCHIAEHKKNGNHDSINTYNFEHYSAISKESGKKV